ncbi:MAG: PorT family protein [Dysgonamonadaceae bacterium]|jgi:hypothetical protein|nr:PorT family protein [Dysgonamonadaceae bacterium]
MRKIIIISLFIIVFCNTAFAQYIRYGIVSGIDISNFDVNYPIEYDLGYSDYHYKIGYRVAFTMEYMMIPDVLHLSTEIAFTQRGAKQTQTPTQKDTVYSKHTYNINYFQMPVNILYKIEIQEDTKFFVFTGPYIAYAISGKRKSDHKHLPTGQTWKNEPKYQFGTEIKSLDLGYNVGLGLEYFDYFLKIQYNYSLINLLYGDDYYQKNRNFGISVGILF